MEVIVIEITTTQQLLHFLINNTKVKTLIKNNNKHSNQTTDVVHLLLPSIVVALTAIEKPVQFRPSVKIQIVLQVNIKYHSNKIKILLIITITALLPLVLHKQTSPDL